MKDKEIKRGEIYFADLGERPGSIQSGVRPIVILQNNVGNKYSPTVVVGTVTSKVDKKRNQPTHVYFKLDELSKVSVAQLEQITTLNKDQLIEYVGQLPKPLMNEIDEAVKISLDLT